MIAAAEIHPDICVPEFDQSAHAYKWNGEPVPGVTAILKRFGFIDDRWFTEASRERGTITHLACQFFNEGDLDWEHLSRSNPDIYLRVRALERFVNETGFKCQAAELRVCNPVYRYGGTIDAIGLWKGHWAIIDYKTGKPQWWTKYQTAAYRRCVPHAAVQRYALELKADGTYSLDPHIGLQDVRVFESAAMLYHTIEERQ